MLLQTGRGRGRERERERERKNTEVTETKIGAFCRLPERGPNLQPKHVP